MKQPVFTGAATAIVTPFDETGVNYDVLGRLIDWQIAESMDALVICGTTGESPVLTDEEHRKCIEYTVSRVAGRVPVIAGTGSNDTRYGLELSLHAKEAGADGLLMVTPYYNKTTQKGLVAHYTYIADRVELPIIVYNVPSRTGLCASAATYKALSAHPWINGVKEASGDFTLIAQTRAECGDDLFVWSGNDDNTLPVLSLGGSGVITTSGNIIPRVMHDICARYFAGDSRGAMELHLNWFDLMNTLFIETNPIPVKTAMNLMGFGVGDVRLPLCDMTEANLQKLKNSLTRAGLL